MGARLSAKASDIPWVYTGSHVCVCTRGASQEG